MDLKQQFQQDMRDAMRTHDQARVNVIRMLLAAFEHAQEAMGKQAFDAFDSDVNNIQLDRYQTLSKEAIQGIIRNEIQSRREALTFFALVEKVNVLKVKRPRLRYWRII